MSSMSVIVSFRNSIAGFYRRNKQLVCANWGFMPIIVSFMRSIGGVIVE